MGASKSQLFSGEQNELAGIAKVLAHPARIAILEVLAGRQQCICGDIVDELPLAQPTISQHLRELKSVGLITGSIEGTSICYCVDQSRLAEIRTLLEAFLNKLTATAGCC